MLKILIDKIVNKRGLLLRALLFVLCAALCFVLMPAKQQFKYDFKYGDVWRYEELDAPFDFPLLKSRKQLEEEREKIYETRHLYFSFNELAAQQSMENLSLVSAQESMENIYPVLESEINAALKKGIVSNNAGELLQKPDELVYIVRNGVESLVSFSSLTTLNGLAGRVYETVVRRFGGEQAEVARLFVEGSVKPNLNYDMELSELSVSEQINSVSPSYGLVPKGKHIISRGEPIGDSQYLSLASLKAVYDNSLHESKYTSFGYLLVVVMLFSLLFLYVRKYKKGLYFGWKELLFLLFNIMLSFTACRLTSHYMADLIFMAPLGIQVLAVRSFLNSRIALVTQVVTIFLCSLLAANFPMFIFVGFASALIGSLSTNITQRSMIFIASSKITFAALVAALAFIFIQNDELGDYAVISYICLGGVLTLFTLPLIYVYERIFGLVSDVSLLEITSNKAPLLRRLADEAPGTFQHSLSTANLAEEAARVLGAKELLVAAGAMYHDIGKLYGPQYFIENQTQGYNPHDDMPPVESVKKIVAHISEGLDMAVKNRLPKSIVRFIRTHHGRSLVYYFYRKAKQEGVMDDEEKFRYPFQKPYTKEEAILMVCDSIEAASRSLGRYTQESLSELVDDIMDGQLKDGQFDEADISYRELIKLREFLKKRLVSQYHLRIGYKQPKPSGTQKAR